MKAKILSIFVLMTFLAFGQDAPILRTFVKQDTVQLRWFVQSSANFLDGLKEGYIIEKKENGSTSQIIVQPWDKRKKEFENLESEMDQTLLDYINDFAQAEYSAQLDIPFAMIMLGASSNRTLAKMAGLYVEEYNLSDQIEYRIKVKGTETFSNSEKVNPKKLSQNVSCTELNGESRVDLKEAYLKFEAKELNPYYGGYFIYRSEDKKNWKPMNETALYHFTSEYEQNKTIIDYVDTTVVEGETYYYQVQPMNHFADKGVKSNVVEVYIQKRLNGFCIIDTVVAEDFNRKIIGFYQSDFEEDEIGQYTLFRSDSINGPYAVISTQKTTEKKFDFDYKAKLTSGDRHYFKVAAVSVDGDTAFSYPYYHFSLDQIPPGVCIDLKGVIDSVGIARLNWTAPEDEDIQGYRVFRSNSPTEELIEVTRYLAQDEHFEDTLYLGTLTNEVFYRVRAVDNNFNNGPMTSLVKLMKPDTIAPVPAVFKAYEVRDEGIYLAWNNSPSSDVQNQLLLRSDGVKIDSVLVFEKDKDSILDTSGKIGSKYAYQLIAVDESGNVGRSQTLQLKYEIGYRPAPTALRQEVNRAEQHIKLEWNAYNDEIYAVRVFRAKNDGKMRLFKTIRDNASEFIDEDLNINNQYHYKVQVVYKGGIYSKMSEGITVVY